MPDEAAGPIWTLTRIGPRVVNVAKLILSEDLGPEGVEVTLEAGATFRLTGDDAVAWRAALDRFVPAPAGGVVERTRVVRRRPGEKRG